MDAVTNGPCSITSKSSDATGKHVEKRVLDVEVSGRPYRFCRIKVELSRFWRQPVKTQLSLNREFVSWDCLDESSRAKRNWQWSRDWKRALRLSKSHGPLK